MQYCYEVNLPVLIHKAYNEKVKQLKPSKNGFVPSVEKESNL